MLAIENFKVPVPALFTFKALEATPVIIAVVVMFKVSLAPTLMISELLAVLSKVIPPEITSVLLPVTESVKVEPFFKVMALAIVNAALPLKVKVAPLLTVTEGVLRPEAMASFKTPPLTAVGET